MKLDPAHSVIAKLGGPELVSRVTGRDLSRVYRWTYPRERGGTGGIIPHREAEKLLQYAQIQGIELEAADFFATSRKPSPGPKHQLL